jgi:crotonobetainyl-CoA:carnitine CoA-transferase CaiB-like acyl-CoA transferase
MDKLKAILESNGVTKTEEELRQYVEKRGMNPDNLNDTDVVTLSNALINNGKMTQSKGGKPTTKGKRSPQSPNNLNAAIKKVAHQTSLELGELTDAIEQGAEQYSQAQAQRMLDSLANVPNQTVQHFADLAQDYEGDPEGFRRLGNEIAQALFGSFATNAAE